MSRFFLLRDIHSHKIGYVKTPRRSAAPTPPAPPVMLQIANGAAEEPSETPPLRSHGNYVNAVPIAFAPPGFNLTPVKTEPVVAPGEPMRCSPSPPNMQTVRVMNHTSSPSMARGTGSAETRKRRNDDSALAVAVKRQAMQDLAGSSSSTNQVSTDNLAVFEQKKKRALLFLVHTVALIVMRSVCYIDLSLTKQNKTGMPVYGRARAEGIFLLEDGKSDAP